jgi:HAD superfamily hydrolase (TIGR01509 family)
VGKADLSVNGARGPVRAVIFDLDGVLVDSEPNYFESERRLLADYGIDFTPVMKRPYIGMSTKEMLDDVVPRFGIPERVDVLLARKNTYYLDIAARASTVYAETRHLLQLLYRRGYPLALASGSSPDVIDVVLSAAGLLDLFDLVVSAESVARGKPAPDLFLAAARGLGVEPAGCVVLEDSSHGVRAAISAGMRCIAIPYLLDAPLDESFSGAHLLIGTGMAGLRADDVFEWIRSQN